MSDLKDIWIGRCDNINSWKMSMEDKNYHIDTDSDFITWSKNQPNNLNGNQHCVLYSKTGKVNDQACEKLYPFICYNGMNKLLLLVTPPFMQEFWIITMRLL